MATYFLHQSIKKPGRSLGQLRSSIASSPRGFHCPCFGVDQHRVTDRLALATSHRLSCTELSITLSQCTGSKPSRSTFRMAILVRAVTPPSSLLPARKLGLTAVSGPAEAIVRGHKAGLLSVADYNNLSQCETLEDIKLNLVGGSGLYDQALLMPLPGWHFSMQAP